MYVCPQVSEGAVLELMEQDSKDSAQSSSTSTSTIDTASQPEYKVQRHHWCSVMISAYPSTYPLYAHAQTTHDYLCLSTCLWHVTVAWLCLNAKITAFVITAYPLACESQSRAPGSSVSTDGQDKEAEWVFCELGRLAKSLLTTDTLTHMRTHPHRWGNNRVLKCTWLIGNRAWTSSVSEVLLVSQSRFRLCTAQL